MNKNNVKTIFKLLEVMGLIFAVVLVAKGTLFN